MSINNNNLSGIILAGGKSSRFGFNKIEVKIDKIPLFIDQVFKLSDFCSEILIITSEKNRKFITSELECLETYSPFYQSIKLPESKTIRVFNDEHFYGTDISRSSVGAGPVIGLYTGLKNACSKYSIVLAFDMPFISRNLLKVLAESPGKTHKAANVHEKDALIVKTDKGFEVLCGLYSSNCLNYLKSNILRSNFKISDIFKEINLEMISEDELAEKKIDSLNFFNINNLEDYYKFNDIWKNRELPDSGENPDGTGEKSLYKYFIKKWESFYLR